MPHQEHDPARAALIRELSDAYAEQVRANERAAVALRQLEQYLADQVDERRLDSLERAHLLRAQRLARLRVVS